MAAPQDVKVLASVIQEAEEKDIMMVKESQNSKEANRESSKSKSSSQTQAMDMQACISSYMRSQRHDEANEAISSWQYGCGIPFNFIRHPAWQEMVIK